MARRVEDAVVTAQITRVVIGDFSLGLFDRFDPAIINQLRQKLAVVIDLVIAAELRILVA